MRCILFLTTIFFATACAGTQQVDTINTTPNESIVASLQNLETTIDAIVQEEMEATHLPGVAIVVVHGGQTIIKRGYGIADIASGRPVDTERTLFRIGSVTKALTGLALTRLVDDGRVNLDDDVTKYFDKITNMSGTDDPVTVENLLTHTSGFDQIGLGRHVYEFDRPLDERKAMRPSLADYLGDNNLRRVTPPGQLFRYDTYGISLAGLVVARATGLSYAEAMQQELFEPLGMTHSFVEADADHFGDLAIGHGWRDNAYVPQPYEVYMTTPASSIDATPADMARLLEAITGGGANKHGRLYSKQTAHAVLSPQYRPHPRFTGITHGFWESPSVDPPEGPSVHSVGHGGSMLGFWTLMDIFTEKNVAVFMVANRNFEAGGGPVNLGSRISRAVLDALYETPPTQRLSVAVPLNNRDLRAYEGDYAFGTFCKSCSPEEMARGAWSLYNPQTVKQTDHGLMIDNEAFLPTAEEDVFLREDRQQEVFFGRNEKGEVSFFVTSYGPSAMERVPGLTQLREGFSEAEALFENNQRELAQNRISKTLELAIKNNLQNEGTINNLGYQYLGNGNLEMAIYVFQFNTQAFPNSWNVHDSLGEALALAGRYTEAIAAYQRSLTLNPDSPTGKAALDTLQAK